LCGRHNLYYRKSGTFPSTRRNQDLGRRFGMSRGFS
jgi:hypothetical protein